MPCTQRYSKRNSSRAIHSVPSLGVATRISATSGPTSWSGMPAFIVTQPPTEPGIPALNSRPREATLLADACHLRMRHAGLGVEQAAARNLDFTQPLHAQDDALDAAVEHQRVEAAAEDGQRDVVLGAERHQRLDLLERLGNRPARRPVRRRRAT